MSTTPPMTTTPPMSTTPPMTTTPMNTTTPPMTTTIPSIPIKKEMSKIPEIPVTETPETTGSVNINITKLLKDIQSEES